MRRFSTLVAAAIALTWLLPAAALAQPGADAFAQGKTLLASGDLDGALAAYQSAARANQANVDYLQQFAMVRQAVELRNRLQGEGDPQRWEFLARALHSFYVREQMYPSALELAGEIYQRIPGATSATVLAETALALEKNEVASDALARLDAQSATPVTQALLGVALARQGKVDEARQLAGSIRLGDDAEPSALYSLARLQSASGDSASASATLVRLLETTPPSRAEAYKHHARQCPDFASLASTAEFTKALETASKVSESKCSGGSSCAGCPMRSKCGHSAQP